MKKLLSILLLLLLIFQSLGVISIFKFQELRLKKIVKQRIKNGIPKSEHLNFSFHLQYLNNNNLDLKFIHSKEFSFKGEMYDVLFQREIGDSIHFTVIHDPKETGLFANLDKIIQQEKENNSENKKLNEKIKNLIALNYINNNSEIKINIVSEMIEYFDLNEIYLNPFISINSPPPKLNII